MSGRADALQSLADKVSAEYALDGSLVLNKWSMINGKTNGLGYPDFRTYDGGINDVLMFNKQCI